MSKATPTRSAREYKHGRQTRARQELAAAKDSSYVHVLELELELIQTQMTQKPVLRAEVYTHAIRASQNRK